MRAACRVCVVLAVWLVALAAAAQVPGTLRPHFEGWAPIGAYERAAFRERGALRMTIPTRHRNVDVSFTPGQLLANDYGAEQIDRGGLRRGGRAPRFTAYTGRVEANSGRDFAKLGFAGGDGKLAGLLRIDGAFYALEADLAAGDYLLDVREISEDEVAGLMRACGVMAAELGDATASGSTATGAPSAPLVLGALQLEEIELGTEADAPFVAQVGGAATANTRMLAIVNMVNGIYETDLGLTNRVVVQRTHTSADPYTTSDSNDLLDQFRAQFASNVSTPYDDAMLFSGRDLDGSTVGVAFIDATCTPWRYGLAQFVSGSDSLTGLVAAHELGHNLGARHSGSGIMAPTIDPANDSFSQASKDEIALYVAGIGCLAPANGSGGNAAPVLQPVGPQNASEGQLLSIQLLATDPDGDPIRYGASPLPPGATLSTGGLFEWLPPRSSAGCNGSQSTTVRFTASDGSLSASESVPISVADVQTGATPALLDPADRSTWAGRLLQFQLQASDADGDTVSFSSSNLPAGATLSPLGVFSWTPTTAQVGTTTIGFAATDCTGRGAAQSVDVSVTLQPPPHLLALSRTTGWHKSTLTISGTSLAGNAVRVVFVNKRATIVSLADDSVTVIVPKVKKKLRKAGPQPVYLVRDGVTSDNTLLFDYVKP